MTYILQLTFIVLSPSLGESPAPKPPLLTRDQLVTSSLARLSGTEVFGTRMTDCELDAIRNELSAFLRTESVVPESISIEGVPEHTVQEILSRPVRLLSTSPEYCRAIMRSHLMGLVGALEVAKHMPMPRPEDRARIAGHIDRAVAEAEDAIRRELGSLIPEQILVDYVALFRASMLRSLDSPLDYSYKVVPLTTDVDSLLADFRARLKATKDRAAKRFGEDLPSPASPRYDRALKGLCDELLFQILSFLERGLRRLTEVPPDGRVNIEELVPGITEAARTAAEYDKAFLIESHRVLPVSKPA